jgi:UDP-glucose 4-epimerase
MAGRVVLVTGVTRFIGSELAGRLARHPEVDRVIGVDAALPEPAARARMGDADFARVDIRNPLIARVIEAARVDTVVHASASATPASSAARSMVKEMNVLGTMQLLAACQRSDSLRNLIVRSTAAIYGSSSRDPAIFTEETPARSVPSSGPARDAIDIEAYVRGFGRRRPDVRIAVPRFADIIGPTVVTPLTRYFALSPFVPMVLGRDARIQLVHESDAVGVMEHLAIKDFSGVVNVAGDGVLTLAQAIHRAGRLPLSVPAFTLGGISRVMRTARLGGFSPRQVESLTTGRVLDTTRLLERAGYQPHFTTVQAFDDFAAHLRPALPASTVRGVEKRITGTLGLRPEPGGPDRDALLIGSGGTGSSAGQASRSVTPAGPPPGGSLPVGGRSAAPGGDTPDGDDRLDGRPRLVGITGDAAGPPRRWRTR